MMRAIKHMPGLSWLPSLMDAAVVMPVAFLFIYLNGATQLLADADTGWHIRTGEWILRHAQVPQRDLFSFSRPDADWLAWEWLWDAAFAWLHRQGGMAVVVMASVLAISATSALLYRLALRLSGNAAISAAVTFLAAVVSSIHWLARPHLFTILFAVIVLDWLDRAKNNPRQLLWLPPLVLLWTQIHGGFLVSIVFIAAYAAGAALDRSWRQAMYYGAAAAGCLAASVVNPYGLRLHAHIWNYVSDYYQFRYIAEFMPLAPHHPAAPFFNLLLISGIAAAAWDISRRRFATPLLVLFWAHFATQSGRHIPIFAIVAAPVVARAAAECLARMQSRAARATAASAESVRTRENLHRIPVAGCVALVIVCSLLYAPEPPPKFKAQFDEFRYPARAVASLRTELVKSRVFTTDEWGDYLIYRLYPDAKVFIDGRSDFYGAEFGERYHQVLDVKHGWEEQLNRFTVNAVLLPSTSALSGALRESPRWTPVFDDGVAVMFRPDVAANQVFSAPLSGDERGRKRAFARVTVNPKHKTTDKHI